MALQNLEHVICSHTFRSQPGRVPILSSNFEVARIFRKFEGNAPVFLSKATAMTLATFFSSFMPTAQCEAAPEKEENEQSASGENDGEESKEEEEEEEEEPEDVRYNLRYAK